MEMFDKLKAPFPRELISWRVGSMNKDKTKAIALAYIDARDVMGRLDDVCGACNWQNNHPHANGKTSCSIGIKVGGEWVWKENGCGDSQVEAEKGAFSDSFKRAAVQWGIGRYLYDVPNIWTEIEPNGKSYKIKNPQDPRLSKALDAAEKGIRLAHEEEPKVETKPVSGDDFLLLQRDIKGATTLDQLKSAWSLVSEAIVAERMTKEQADTLTKQKEDRKIFLMNSPIEEKEAANA